MEKKKRKLLNSSTKIGNRHHINNIFMNDKWHEKSFLLEQIRIWKRVFNKQFFLFAYRIFHRQLGSANKY